MLILARPITFLSSILTVLMLFSILQPAHSESNCTIKDREHADSWDNYYNPEEAWIFSIKIQNLVRDRNLLGLFELVEGELSNGPRKSFIKMRSFDEVFPEKWRHTILESKPQCSPVGWRGFMLGNGLIWFNTDKNTWGIFSINGALQEKYEPSVSANAWRVKGRIIPPQCFVKIWMSGDNFEAFEEKFDIQNTDDFRKYTGRYFGREISSIEPVDAPWGDGEKVNLASLVEDCTSSQPPETVDPKYNLSVGSDGVSTKKCNNNDGCIEEAYQLLSPVSLSVCQSFAPQISGQCQAAYLVQIGDYSGGSIGWDFQYNIYGLFKLEDGRDAVVPLVNFYNENNARNFIDNIRSR